MKVLVLTNLFPFQGNLQAGVFITRRLELYKNLNIDYVAVPVSFEDTFALMLIRRISRKGLRKPVESVGKANYTAPTCKKTTTAYLRKLFRKGTKAEGYFVRISCEHFVKCLENRLDISNFDLIHAHGMYMPPAGLIAWILAQKYSKPYVITLHGSDVNVEMEKRKDLYIKVLESAERVIFVSNALLGKAKSFGYSGKNAVVIPNGYDAQLFKPLDKDEVRKSLRIYENGYKYVGFVGNLIEIKRADRLIEIFEKVRQTIPKVKFIVVGDGPLRIKMEKEAEEKGLDILFVGNVPQDIVAQFMNAMDVMVLPSRNEGFGAVVIEAHACGTCVVGSSNGGIPEAIGFPEYVVEEGEHFEERFAKRVAEVLRDGYDRDALINRAKEYTWESIVLKEKQVYEDVLGKWADYRTFSTMGT